MFPLLKEEDINENFILMLESSGRTDPKFWNMFCLFCVLLVAGNQRGVERCSSLLMKYSPRRCGPSSVLGIQKPA